MPESAPAVRPRWYKPLTGVAIAASVALAVVVTVPALQSPSGDPVLADNRSPTAAVASSRVFPATAGGAVGGPGMSMAATGETTLAPVAGEPLNAKRLDRYLLRHTEQAALNNGHGMMSFARVASFDIEE